MGETMAKTQERAERGGSPEGGLPNGSTGAEISRPGAAMEETGRTASFEGLWSVYECAEFLAYSPQSLWALVQRGDGPPAFRIGNRRGIRFRPAEVRKWLETRRIGKTEGEK